MKYYILILFTVFALSCNNQSEVREEDCPKPIDIPNWIKWDCDKDAAYKKGDIYFNEDSTAFAYGQREDSI